jgi:hypothetical protein
MFGQTLKKDVEEKPLTAREAAKAEKLAEQKKRINIFLSRSSGEEAKTGYQTSRSAFAGGEVESRSRVSRIGSGSDGRTGGYAGAGIGTRAGFAKGSLGNKSRVPSLGGSSAMKPPTRPLGM